MTTMYLADMLCDGYGADPTITTLLDRVEVIVIPVVNPDGYEFTYAPGGYRFWRKNRRDNAGTCEGVDLNRNWGSDWNGGQSTSTDPCSDIYVGPSSMSEPEVQALADYCLNHGNIRAQIDFHAFSQLILEPRGYTPVPPADFDELHALGGLMSDAIFDVHGKNYVNDNPAIIFDKQVDLRTEPNLRSEEINTLHEGTKLNIIEKIDDWSYIELKNGNKGWLTSSSYRLIR